MNLLLELSTDVRSDKLLPSLLVGSVMGIAVVIHCNLLAAIIFSGPLLPFIGEGLGMVVLGGTVVCLVVASTSGLRGVLAVPQFIPAAMLASVGAAMAASLSGAPYEVVHSTLVVLLIVTSVITGLCCLGVGHFRLAGLSRFIPYPVMGGFIAGTGSVLLLAALSWMSGVTPQWETLPRFFEPAVLWKWAPGVAYGLVLLFMMNRWRSLPLGMASLVLAAALYHLGLYVLGISTDEARSAGLLLPHMDVGHGVPVPHAVDLASVSWNVLAALAPDILAVSGVTLLCMSVRLVSLKLATGMDVDVNREFKVAGLAGTIAGVGGGPPGYHAFAYSLPSWMFGADARLTGFVAAAVLGLSLVTGGTMVQAIPVSIIGGVLLFVGFGLVNKWLIGDRRKMHSTDVAIVLTVFLTTVFFGLFAGLGAGLIATMALFVVRVGREDAVADAFTGCERHSKKHRSVPDRAILRDQGERIRGYRLRGYVFFGSVHRLVDRLKRSLNDASSPVCIVLDFAAVSGIDLSASNALSGFIVTADRVRTRVVLSAASEPFTTHLREILPDDVRDRLVFESDLDHALERCEDMLLAVVEPGASGAAYPRSRLLDRAGPELERYLERLIVFEELVDALAPWLEPRTYAAGEALGARGEAGECLHFLVKGRASVYDADGKRLFEYGPGDVIERRAGFGAPDTSLSTVAQEPCRAMMLTSVGRLLLESNGSGLGVRLCAYLLGHPIEPLMTSEAPRETSARRQ